MPIFSCPKDPNHISTDPDYCSVCGAKISAAPLLSSSPPVSNGVSTSSAVALAPPAPVVAPVTPALGPELCPVCGTERIPGARFCEICRYNFETANAHPVVGSTSTSTSAPSITSLVVPPMDVTPPAFMPSSAPVTSPTLSDPPEQPGESPDAVTVDPSAVPPDDSLTPPVGDAVVDSPPLSTTPLTSDADPLASPPDSGAITVPPPDLSSLNGSAPLVPPSTPPPVSKWQVTIIVDAALYTPDPALPLPVGQPDLVFPLELDENLIGRRSTRRDAKPDIPLNDPGVSHRHAKLYREADGTWSLLELGSTNGTRVNGADIQPGAKTPLYDGDQITLGCWTRIALREVR